MTLTPNLKMRIIYLWNCAASHNLILVTLHPAIVARTSALLRMAIREQNPIQRVH